MNIDHYIKKSLELHLFFGRIMKEHSFFLKAGFTPADADFAEKAENYKKEFEELLSQAITLGDGIVSRDILESGELVTDFTAVAEKQTEGFTGIPINRELTVRELRLTSGRGPYRDRMERGRLVQQLNRKALRLLDGLISFKETILKKVLHCEMFTMNYPLLIEHITREAKLYREYIWMLEKQGDLSRESMKEVECFWNQIMMEHAMFIRGLLDPSEEELFHAADDFANEYSKLLETCRNAQDRTMAADSLEATRKIRDFKSAGAEGIINCQIRSVILPLLADHVLREANHYIRLLEK